MRKKILFVLILSLFVGWWSAVSAANFYWKSSLAALNTLPGAGVGDRAIVITDAGIVSFYYYKSGRWNEMSSFNKLGDVQSLSIGTTSGTVSAGDHTQTAVKGGTGQDSSSWTGIPYVSSGTWANNNAAEARRLLGLGPVALLSMDYSSAMADEEVTLTSALMTLGSFYSNVSWTAGHTVNLPVCNAAANGAMTTLAHVTTHAIKVKPNAANKILGLTSVNGTAAAIASPALGDMITLRCVKSGASTYDWWRWWIGVWVSD